MFRILVTYGATLAALSSAVSAEVIWQDGFDNGTFDSQVYEATGGASLEVRSMCPDRTFCNSDADCSDGSECNFKLLVHVFSTPEDGNIRRIANNEVMWTPSSRLLRSDQVR